MPGLFFILEICLDHSLAAPDDPSTDPEDSPATCGWMTGTRNPPLTAFSSCASPESSPSSHTITPPRPCCCAYTPLKRAEIASSYVQNVSPSYSQGACALGSRYTVEEAIRF